MSEFVFDKEIFKKKFIKGDSFSNRAKSLPSDCDSICPTNSDNGKYYNGYQCKELLSDTIHYLKGEVFSDKEVENIEDEVINETLKQIEFKSDDAKGVFSDVIKSFYFDEKGCANKNDLSLLLYQKPGIGKDYGKFIVDVLFDDKTKERFLQMFDDNGSPLDKIVGTSYMKLNILKALKTDREYSRLFENDLGDLFYIMNVDFRAALDGGDDVVGDMEFLLSYYLYIYLTQVAMRLDNDLDGKEIENVVLYFKPEKENVSEDRECVAQGWRKVERKTGKIFKHLIVLNMLNCHNNSTPYLSYSGLYKIYEMNIEERKDMDDALDFLISQYTEVYKHDTDVPGSYVDFSTIDFPKDENQFEEFKKKVQYLYKCVSFQLDSKNYRQTVVSYVASNYNYILKMRFVKSWGKLGNMMIVSNEDLIRMIQTCQKNSTSMDMDRGIQISDLFKEFSKRKLFLDGKSKQHIIDHLIDINLIDSKCDSEEAQYVKRIQ